MKTRFARYLILSLLILLTATVGMAVLAAQGLMIPASRATGGGQVMTGGSYMVIGAIGQPDAGILSGGEYRINGGVIGEMVPKQKPPVFKPRAYLPVTWQDYPQWSVLDETEPNNLFSQADPVPSLPALVSGSHDGSAGGGDVFSLSLESGRIVDVSLLTENVSGVQLLAYDAAGTLISRSYAEPFELAFTTTYNGAYYVYVFSSPDANNYAHYTLTLRAGGPLTGIEVVAAPVMDGERLNKPPEVGPVP